MRIEFTLNFGNVSIPPVLPQLYRVLHDAERGPLWRWRVPEVYPLGGTATPMTKEWQLFIKALNPLMTGEKWRALFRYNTAFSNFDAGFDFPDGTLKPDYVNMRDLNASGRLKLDKCRICGGALVKGVEAYSVLQAIKNAAQFVKTRKFTKAVKALVVNNVLVASTLDGGLPPTPVDQIPIWHKFVALNVVDETTLSKFPQGGGHDVWMPFVARETINISLAHLEKLDMTKPLPDPYRI